ncbi:MAG: mechanosensitive ion channel [Bacteroidales bacterium]|nr:mechanosensitive ion channel [Bacteroidales bacterium]
MLHNILQTLVQEEQVENLADTLRVEGGKLLTNVVNDPRGVLHDLLDKAIDFGLKVLGALAIYIIGAWLIRRIKRLLLKIFEKRKTEKTIVSFVLSLVTLLLTVLLIVITVSALGINTSSFAALLAAVGVALGMALSGTVQNFAGGIIILAFKPFKAGDYIEAQGFGGFVKEVNILNTRLITRDNKEIVLANGTLSNGNVINYSTRPIRRVDRTISVAYGTNAQECIDALVAIMKEDPRILDSSTPGAADPFAGLEAQNSSDISFTVRAWVKTPDYWDVFFDLNQRMYTELPAKGIHFAYPHLDVKIRES